MSEIEKFMEPLTKGSFTDLIKPEDIAIRAAQSMIEDEIKVHIKETLDRNPALKAELKKAIRDYMEAKVKVFSSQLKIMSLTAKLGVEMLPDDLKTELSDEFIHLFEKDLGKLLERTL